MSSGSQSYQSEDAAVSGGSPGPGSAGAGVSGGAEAADGTGVDRGVEAAAGGDRVAALAATLRAFAEERDWQQFHTPKNLAMALSGEVGELLAELQWLTPEESARVMADPEAGGRVRAEIGDVMIYLTRLADVLGIDLVRAASDKLADSARRYPADQARGRATKAP